MSKPTVLIVDDEENVREGLALHLRRDHRVLFAADALQAMAVIQAEAVDVLVADYMMPGPSGLDLLKMVRAHRPDVVRIMLTGRADLDLVLKAVNDGEVFRFLTKPVDATDLLLTVFLATQKGELDRAKERLHEIFGDRPELVARLERALAQQAKPN